MSKEKDNLYVEGVVNPGKLGFTNLTTMAHSFGEFDVQIEECCKRLKRKKSFVNSNGYEVEMIAAAQKSDHIFSWIESKAKDSNGTVDITFTLYLCENMKIVHSWNVETYNPYFGCDVSYMQWWGNEVITIYREKHDTYIASIGLSGNEKFHAIEDDWLFSDDKIYYVGYQETKVSIRQIPSLHEIDGISIDQAKQQGVLPG